MKIPHKVKIKPGVFYEVVWVDKFDDPDQLGYCTADKRLIYIKKDLSEKESMTIFLHELLHALEFEYGLKIPHKLIYSLQDPLWFVFNANPAIVPNLLGAAARKKPKAPRRKRHSR